MRKTLHVLLLEDNPDDAELVVLELRRAGFEPDWLRVETEAEYLAGLDRGFDIILSDYALPQFNGLRALELLKERGSTVPFVIISGTLGEEQAVEAMKMGATDYLLKDRTMRLGQVVESALAQRRLREDQDRMQQAFLLQSTALEAAANGIMITDDQGSILWVNSAFTALTGYTGKELWGKTPRRLRSGVHDSKFYQQMWTTILAGEVWNGELTNRRKDGSSYEEEMTITPVHGSNGKITHFIAIKQDITQRKLLQQELWLRDQRLNSFFSNATAGLCILDADLRFVQINETLARINRLPANEHIGRTLGEVLPTLAPFLEPMMRGILRTGESVLNQEISGETPAEPGIVRHWIASYFPVVGEQGKPAALGSVVVEVTERKRAEEALQESEEKFRQLAENINEVFWITDPLKNQMLYISPAYEKIWGRTCQSLYQSPGTWMDAIHPDDRERIQKAALDKQQSGDYNETYRITRPDGSIRWIHDQAFPIRDGSGVVYRLVGTAEDITVQRGLEDQFRQAQKMEVIGQLAGGVAHDFNNILTVIQCYTELLLTEKITPDVKESLQQIFLAGGRASALTRQLLAFSRKQAMQLRSVDLNQLIDDLNKMMARLVGEDVELLFQPALNLPLITADAGMLEQVIMNLVVNARDAMPDGGRLRIETGCIRIKESDLGSNPDTKPGEYVVLTVIDSGTGMPPEVLTRIFEPFFTTKAVGRGTGLGLATVFGIVKQHQGWIDVASEVGRGSTFKIFLPHLGTSSADHLVPDMPGALLSGHEIILLVEDESSVRQVAKVILEKLGYRVIEAVSGVAALEQWRIHQAEIALLITDLVMPGGMSGVDLAGKLREEKPGLKTLFTSGYSADLVGRVCVVDTSENFLQKPYAPQKLARAVRECLDEAE